MLLAQIILSGTTARAVYALVALGFVLIYNRRQKFGEVAKTDRRRALGECSGAWQAWRR